MRYRKLGSTDLNVSEIGFGCWPIGGDAYGRTDDATSLAALQAALDCGVNFFDTADVYGKGHSEALLAQAFEGRRHDVIIATKGGALVHPFDELPKEWAIDFSPQHLRDALEASLRRLKTDYVDLYQLHSPPVDMDGAWATLIEFRAQGKARAVGVSAKTPHDGLMWVQAWSPAVDILMVNLSLLDQRAVRNGLFPLCRKIQTGVIARTPLSFGFLTGEIEKGVAFTGPDHRKTWPAAQRDTWAEGWKLFDHLREPGQTRAQFALAYCLGHDAVSTVIPGMLTPEQVRENAAVGDGPLLAADVMQEIARIYEANEFYVGR